MNVQLRAVWIALALLAALIVGAAAGLLSFIGGVAPPLAVLAGGGAFGATVILILTVLRYATEVNGD
jgi:hypothetical protein